MEFKDSEWSDSEWSCVILAGGTSRRMGRDKSQIDVAGAPMLRRTCAAVAATPGGRVIVGPPASHPPDWLKYEPDWVWLTDELPSRGPLEGVRVGLRYLAQQDHRAALLLGCDYPLFPIAVARLLHDRLRHHQATWIDDGERMCPLPAFYRTEVYRTADNLIARGRTALHDLLSAIQATPIPLSEVRSVDPELNCLLNINDPGSLERLLNHRHWPENSD